MDQTPAVLETVVLPHGRVELVEWHWPDIIDFERTERDLMLEVSLPPHATDASVEFPAISPGNRCLVGPIFVRYPNVAIHGRGEGGHIRVLRFVFDADLSRQVLGDGGIPSLVTLQSLLDIRNDSLRKIMALTLREINTREDRSPGALAALQMLAATELRRLLQRHLHPTSGGRLAAWQYRRIRERLAQGSQLPTVAELAGLCGISVRHLNRQFLTLTGKTVAEYVTHFWVERAKPLLMAPNMPIKNIAFTLGFAHPNSFARAFRRATGLSPQDYRKRAGAASTSDNSYSEPGPSA